MQVSYTPQRKVLIQMGERFEKFKLCVCERETHREIFSFVIQ